MNETKEKAEKAATRDDFNCLLSMPPSKINAAMAKKAKTVEEIAAESGQTAKRVLSHLKYWEKKDGRFAKDEKGKWRLVFVPAKLKKQQEKEAKKAERVNKGAAPEANGEAAPAPEPTLAAS